MKKKVGRVEARIIMRNAKEFRAKQAALAEMPVPAAVVEIPVEIPAPIVVPEPVVVVQPPKKKSWFTFVINFFKKKGT